MEQAADFGKLDDLPCHRELDRPEVGRVLVERKMGARSVVVSEIADQDTAEVSLAEDEHVIQALAPDRADEPLREGILPWAVGRGQHFGYPHTRHSSPKRMTISAVAIAEKIAWRGVLREGVHELLSRPGGGGMLGDVEVDDPPAVVSEHHEDE
jgi:hypothetical protein